MGKVGKLEKIKKPKNQKTSKSGSNHEANERVSQSLKASCPKEVFYLVTSL